MDISWQKWLVMALLAVFSLILGLVPYFIVKGKSEGQRAMKSLKFNLLVTFASCFGAGALLATAALHMLPETREGLAELDIWTDLPNEGDFPLAEVLTLSGLLLVYLVEEIAHAIMTDDGHHHVHSHHDTMAKHGSKSHNIEVPHCTHHGDESNLVGVQDVNFNPLRNRTDAISKMEDEEEAVCEPQDTQTGSLIRSLLALIALSLHEIMEGIAIGIEDTENVWVMFGGIASHKLVLSFIMGFELLSSRANMRTYFGSVIFFGVISSVGIFIGSLIDEEGTNNLSLNILRGFATGTILYIVFLEILNRERSRKEGEPFSGRWKIGIGFIQLLAFAVGLIALGALFTTKEHSHSHSHSHPHEEEDGHEDHTHSSHEHFF